MKEKRYPNYKERICLLCKGLYKPTQSRQKVCPPCKKEYWRQYYKIYDKYRYTHSQKQELAKKYYKARKQKVVELMGGCCTRCGFTNIWALQIDHIAGKGNYERKNTKGDYHWNLYKSILNNPEQHKEKYQLLCANCNWIKRYEEGECKTT